MYILIVEDDPVQYSSIKESMIEEDAFSALRIERIATELDFQQKIKEIEVDKPDIIIMDIMLRWTDPSPEMVLPPEQIANEGFYRAGIRCIELLTKNRQTNNIPILIHSVLDDKDLEKDLKLFPQVRHINKTFDPKHISREIRAMVR